MERTKVNSSNIESIAHDPETLTLEIQFKGKEGKGDIYQYDNVPECIHKGLMESESPGRFFFKEIKGKYEFKKVEEEPIMTPTILVSHPSLKGKRWCFFYYYEDSDMVNEITSPKQFDEKEDNYFDVNDVQEHTIDKQVLLQKIGEMAIKLNSASLSEENAADYLIEALGLDNE